MTFEMGTLVSMVAMVVAGAIGYGKLSRQVDENKDTNDKQWIAIDKHRIEIGLHEKESSNYRLMLEKDLGNIRGDIGKWDSKLDSIISRLNDICDELKQIKKQGV